MLRVVRRVLLLAIVAVVAGGAVLVLTARPKLSQARDDAGSAWTAVRAPLISRYAALTALEQAMHDLGPDRDYLSATRAAVTVWNGSLRSGVGAQITAANRLEGLARRLEVAAVDPRSRYAGVAKVAAALSSVRAALPSQSVVVVANRAIRHYDGVRDGALRSIVAGALGYDTIPELVVERS